MESLKLELKSNNDFFDDRTYLQLLGTAMGIKCALPYACLTVGYLEKTKLFTNELPKYFNESECQLMMEILTPYMDDGFIFWPFKLNFENFETC